jgi:Fic family protein
MRREQFGQTAAGRIVPITGFERRMVGGVPQSVAVQALSFVPDALPPRQLDRDVFVGKLADELLHAERGIALLEGTVSTLPNPELLSRPFRMREAKLSSKIENTIASVEEIALHEVVRSRQRDEVREVHNYLRALTHGLGSELPMCARLIREMHGILMDGVRGDEKRPGEFRATPVYIGDERGGFAGARFVTPPPGAELDSCVRDFEAYLNLGARRPGAVRYPDLLELAFMHYQFESIHPFNDGNGRLGRLLIPISFCRLGLLTRPTLYLSAYFEEHRQRYYDLLLRVSTKGDWEAWARFFCQAVASQSRDAVRRARRLQELRREYVQRVTKKRASVLTVRLIDMLFDQPALRSANVQEALGVSSPSAQKHINILESQGVLFEHTGGNYGRVYVARGIIAAVEEDYPEV